MCGLALLSTVDLQGKTELGFVVWFVNASCAVGSRWEGSVCGEQRVPAWPWGPPAAPGLCRGAGSCCWYLGAQTMAAQGWGLSRLVVSRGWESPAASMGRGCSCVRGTGDTSCTMGLL